MTKVLIHGVPETAHIWGPLQTALASQGVEDLVVLHPPGFGAPTPEGWMATPANYVAWLAEELGGIEGPIDLLGHDWGAGYVYGLVAERPKMIRSWAADVAGLLHPDYEWHEAAKAWQTPGEGEGAIDFMLAISNDDRAAAYADLGLPPEIAAPMAAGFDAEMGRCILELYRAAVQPIPTEMGNQLAAAERRPGLVIDPTADAYVSPELAAPVADRLGAKVLTLEGEGHWWMVSAPEAAAKGLADFWKSL